jgi:hypothetical protein
MERKTGLTPAVYPGCLCPCAGAACFTPLAKRRRTSHPGAHVWARAVGKLGTQRDSRHQQPPRAPRPPSDAIPGSAAWNTRRRESLSWLTYLSLPHCPLTCRRHAPANAAPGEGAVGSVGSRRDPGHSRTSGEQNLPATLASLTPARPVSHHQWREQVVELAEVGLVVLGRRGGARPGPAPPDVAGTRVGDGWWGRDR